MKPTSYIFLALSLVLLFCGWFTCSVAESMADAKGIQLFEQSINESGDSVYIYNLTDESLSKLSLTFASVDINIIGSSDNSYVELINFDPYDYSTSRSGGSVNVDGTISGLASFIDSSGGGFRFKGLRYFFAKKPQSSIKRVNVYISDVSELKSLSLSLKKGSVTFKNIGNSVDYNVNVSNGDVVFENVISDTVINVGINNGDLKVKKTECSTLNVNITKGNVYVDASNYLPEYLSYDVKSTNGSIAYNLRAIEEESLMISTPVDIQKCLIKITGTDSNVQLIDASASSQQ